MQDHIDSALADPDRDNCAHSQKRPERHGGLTSSFANGHQRDTDDGTEQKAEKQTNGHEARVQPTQVGAEQGRQTYVAVAHATFAQQVHQAHERERDGRAEHHHQDAPGFMANECANAQQRNAKGTRHVDDLTRQSLCAQVDPAQGDQAGAERAVGPEFPTEVELHGERSEQTRCGQFENEWLHSDLGLTASTFSAERKPAEHGHQVTWPQFEPTRPTRRTRRDHRRAARNAVDNDGQERADQQTQDRRIGNNHESFTSPPEAAPYRRLVP